MAAGLALTSTTGGGPGGPVSAAAQAPAQTHVLIITGIPGEPRFGVLRGGSWARGPEVTRLASREPVDSSDSADFLRVRDRIGLRVAFDP